jgi:hypothetical protein
VLVLASTAYEAGKAGVSIEDAVAGLLSARFTAPPVTVTARVL